MTNRPGTRRRIVGSEHLDVCHPGRIIDGDMKKFAADAARTPTAIAMNPIANALNAAKAFHIDVQGAPACGHLSRRARTAPTTPRD